jgi:diacylglycerol O-acyltransferase
MLRDLPVGAGSGRRRKAVQGGGDSDRRSRRGLERTGTPTGRSLSSADAAFLYLERQDIPLAIASVCIFDGVIPFDEFVASVESKLHLVPRYRQIVVAPPLNLGLPTWQDDAHFDIRRHIFRVSVDSPGGEAELEALAGRILSQVLDRRKPLWDIHVVDGLKSGRGALIFRLHHALADGVSGARLQEMLLDPSPQGFRVIHKPRYRPSRPQRPDRSLAATISSAVHDALGNLIAAEEGLVSLGESFFSNRIRDDLKGLRSLLPELAASVERLPFNKPCGGERRFCWAEIDLADVEAVRKVVGGTVNDVVLTVLTGALARYVKLHGESVVNRFVRIVCPVSLRKGDSREGLGNQISFLPVALPMDVRDPVRMLRAVAARTAAMKHAGAAHLVSLAASCIAAAPAPLQALFWWGLPQVIFPVPLMNMICTNVLGPSVPLYAAGKRMIASYPQVPTGYDLGVNCAVQSYNGKLFFGLIADARVASDVKRLRDFLCVSFRELMQAARKKGRAAAKKSRRRQGKVAGRVPLARKETAKPAPVVSPAVPEAAMGGLPATTPAAPLAEVKNVA